MRLSTSGMLRRGAAVWSCGLVSTQKADDGGSLTAIVAVPESGTLALQHFSVLPSPFDSVAIEKKSFSCPIC